VVAAGNEKKKAFVAGATMVASGGRKRTGPADDGRHQHHGDESFFTKEAKFAKRWLLSKGVMVQEEQRNPVDVELESFFKNCRDGGKPRADLEVGLADAVAVILSNQAMDEGRKVYFNEIDKMGNGRGSREKGLALSATRPANSWHRRQWKCDMHFLFACPNRH